MQFKKFLLCAYLILVINLDECMKLKSKSKLKQFNTPTLYLQNPPNSSKLAIILVKIKS